jgi:signal recognition particle GTPase
MMDTMTDQELDHPELINATARERIAIASGKTVDDVG